MTFTPELLLKLARLPSRKRYLDILIDMDGICCDFIGQLIEVYNLRFNDQIVKADVKDSNFFRNLSKPGITEDILESIMAEPGFFRNLKPYDGAIDSVKALVDAGHNVTIATSHLYEHSAHDKILWLKEHMPFIDRKHQFLGHQKWMIQADVLIDDTPRNVIAWKRRWWPSRVYSIAHPYNNELNGVSNLHAQNSENTEQAWLQILEAIAEIPKALSEYHP